MEQAGISFDAVVAIEIPDEKIVARMGGRRVCEHCGASYHIVNIPPKTEGVCDVCGGKLVQRKDDDPETVRDRLEVYHRETEPLKGFYEAQMCIRDRCWHGLLCAKYSGTLPPRMTKESIPLYTAGGRAAQVRRRCR